MKDWTALVFAVGGLAFLAYRPEVVDPIVGIPIGAWVALIGAGVIDPLMFQTYRSNKDAGPNE